MLFFKHKKENYWLFGIGSGVLEAVYCLFASVLMIMMGKVLSGPGLGNFLLMLMFFVFSAALSFVIIFGYPIYLVFNKKYHEAIYTVLLSITSLIIICLLVVFFIFIIN